MLSYVIRKLLYAVPILMGVSLLTFIMYFTMVPPRQLAKRNLGKAPSQAQINNWLHQHGYDRPIQVQFGDHLKAALMGDYGKSDLSDEKVIDIIKRGAGPSLMLAVPEFIIAAWVTITIALYLGYFRGTYLDIWGVVICVVLMSINYILYIVAGQFILGKLLKIFPLAGYVRGAGGLKFVVLPLIVGVITGMGGTIRYYRAVLLEEMSQDYVRTARARGIPEGKILFGQVLKNAASPILTTLVLAIPFLFLGSLLVETFFGIPGLGSTTVDAIHSADFAVVRAMVFIGTEAYILGNVLTDISYGLVNPRVRFE